MHRTRRRVPVGAPFVLALVLALLPAAPAGAAEQAITTPGTLTRIAITDDLNCAVNHEADERGEFFNDTACGTFVSVGDTLFTPTSVPAGSAATSAGTPFTPGAQSGVEGSGSNADPFRIRTTVALGGTGVEVTETDSYVTGQESYRTDVVIRNASQGSQSGLLWRAGDCFLQNSDRGFGAFDARSGSVSCVAANEDGSAPAERIEQWLPLTGGSSAYHANFNEVWQRIGARMPFDGTCRCDENIDNGAGLSWPWSLAAGAQVSFSHLTTFSPLGQVPLSTSKTASPSTVEAGGTTTYAIEVANPNATAFDLDAIVDYLPESFSYVPGSTTGATTADPEITGTELRWTGTFSVPAGGAATLSFEVNVGSQEGTFDNEAAATAPGAAVAPTGPTAPVTVTGGQTPPPEGPVDRVAGVSRIETAIEVSGLSFPEGGTSTVVLARADTYPDALAGAPLARRLDAPILLTGSDSLDASVADEIDRLGATEAVLLGGEAALTPAVREALLADTSVNDVRRIGGPDRFSTAGLIADEVGGTEAFVAQGFDPDPRRGWPDALAASSLAAYQGRPILLTTTESLPGQTADAIRRLSIRDVTIAGGTSAVGPGVQQSLEGMGVSVGRVSGATRYDTAAALARLAVGAGETVTRTWAASGENFPDALVTGPAAAKDGGVLILVHPQDLGASAATRDFLAEVAADVDEVVLLGGEGAISANVEDQIATIIE